MAYIDNNESPTTQSKVTDGLTKLFTSGLKVRSSGLILFFAADIRIAEQVSGWDWQVVLQRFHTQQFLFGSPDERRPAHKEAFTQAQGIDCGGKGKGNTWRSLFTSIARIACLSTVEAQASSSSVGPQRNGRRHPTRAGNGHRP